MEPYRELLEDLEVQVNQAMDKLSQAFPNFGFTEVGKRNSNSLEISFQKHLVIQLNKMYLETGWCWSREIRYETLSFRNHRFIDIDLIGVKKVSDSKKIAVAIELKYVTKVLTRDDSFTKPSDVYAFPYDILKDCLKLEVLSADTTDGGKSFFAPRCNNDLYENINVIGGFVIGLTNHPYWTIEHPDWNRTRNRFSWALNYRNSLFDEKSVISGSIETVAANNGNIKKRIFSHRRHHLNFGRIWNKSWHDFSSSEGSTSEFRYVLLAPETLCEKPNYEASKLVSPYYIPFGTVEARNEAEKKGAK